MTAGVLEAEDDAKLAVLATPEDGQWLIDRGYTLRLDLPTASKVTSGTPLVIDYAHVRYLPVEGADGLGDDIDTVELWQDSADRGAVFYQTDINDDFQLDRKSDVSGKRVSGSVDIVSRRIIKK